MLVDTPTLREQLLTALSTSHEPLPTITLVGLAPPRIERRAGCHPHWHRLQPSSAQILREECHGDHHVVTRRRYHHEVYQQLRALERHGQVRRIQQGNLRGVLWCATQPATTIDDLEALWTLPARDPR